MLFVKHDVDPGVVCLNYTWLPLWIALNTELKTKMEKELSKHIVGRPLTDAVLLEAHHRVLEFLENQNPDLPGLRDFLDALKYVDA